MFEIEFNSRFNLKFDLLRALVQHICSNSRLTLGLDVRTYIGLNSGFKHSQKSNVEHRWEKPSPSNQRKIECI